MTGRDGGVVDQQPVLTARRTIPLGWILFAVCLVAAAILLPPPATARADASENQSLGGVGVRFVDAPAATAEDPRARLYIIDHLAPGTVIERRIEVTNTTPAPAVVRMYAAGASINDGTFVGDAGDTPNELSTWNAVRPGALDLDAGAHASVTVTNPVPSDAAPGERYAVVWAEIHSGASSLGAVAQVNRVGIRQYLSVGPGGPPAGPLPAGLGSSLAIGDSGQVVIPLDEQVPDGP